MGSSSSISRPARPLAVIVLAGALLAALTTSAGAAPATAVGYDIAFPQCSEHGARYPSGAAFAIVGVNGGPATADNPCLGPGHNQPGQVAWAAASPGLATQPRASYYVIASDPGPGAAAWPAGRTQPERCAGDWSHDCAYDYGYLRAGSSLRLARWVAAADRWNHVPAADPVGAPWWVDVETGARWATAKTPGWISLNIAAVAGFVDGLRAGGVRLDHIGFYSTIYQWRHITGLDASTSRAYFSPAHPDWVAGAKTLEQARSACARTRSFSGGPVTLTQYASGGFDADYRCP
ncbi:MAG: hypothetical protein E6G01_00815 [Actinobacteria bacterium]|nr:MAG: hypothetical protein E6G01_00815 [Actinomycetota bacterium]